ncbi:hypothetical protein FRX31_013898 [Thalictrum thalictroides]|uniref:Late embryogenesis abundant protein LEA-2 subgroup domain-containing protein n=1 Tax=Thalictrum thalictroides TaxID=46969 RepID=A0A7J6WGF7_THATH|nr:hypothetical protein FRX31_013898 [Thalictrum thalictroides]
MDYTNNHATGNPYPPPPQPGYGQPAGGYGQPMQPGYGQPMQPGYGQPHPGYDPNGYMYAAAAPPANYYNHNPTYSYPPHGSASNGHGRRFKTSFVGSFIVGIIIFGILSCFITLMIWLLYRPDWPEFHVDSASASGFNLDMALSKLNGRLDVVFTVRNRDERYSILYEPLRTVMTYKHVPLTYTKTEAFDQDTKNETKFPVNFVASSVLIAPYILRQQVTTDQIHLDLLAMGWIKYKSHSWTTRSYSMRVYCDDIVVRMSPNKTDGDALLSGQKTCKVGSNLWIL